MPNNRGLQEVSLQGTSAQLQREIADITRATGDINKINLDAETKLARLKLDNAKKLQELQFELIKGRETAEQELLNRLTSLELRGAEAINEARAEYAHKEEKLRLEIENKVGLERAKQGKLTTQQEFKAKQAEEEKALRKKLSAEKAAKEKLLKEQNIYDAKQLDKEYREKEKRERALIDKKIKHEAKVAEKEFSKAVKREERLRGIEAREQQTKALKSSLQGPNKLGNLKTATKNAFTEGGVGGGITAMVGLLADLTKMLDNQIESIASKKSIVDTAMQGSSQTTKQGSYWDRIMGDVKKTASISPLVTQEAIVSNVEAMVKQGITFNVSQRAFLATISSKVADSFNATNTTLLRLVRIQEADTTAARLGMESALTSFLNNMYETSEYMRDVAGSVKSSLEEAMALMGAEGAVAFEYQVQKWFGSMYSTGMSQAAVNSISGILGQLAAGQISGLSSGGGSNLIIMAANRAGLSISDILTDGLDNSETNLLLSALVDYMALMYEETAHNNVLQQQMASAFGVTASDLKAAASLNRSRQAVAGSNLGYNDMMSQLLYMTNSMASRTSQGELLTNMWKNFQYTMAGGIANNPVLYSLYKTSGLLKDLVGGIDIPLPLVMGTGLPVALNVADLMAVGALSGSILSGLGSIISGGGGFTGSQLLNSMGIDTTGLTTVNRGSGSGLIKGSGGGGTVVSQSGYVGNEEGGDVYNKTMTDASDDAAAKTAEAVDESEDITLGDVNVTLLRIFELLESFTMPGGKSIYVQQIVPNTGNWNPGNPGEPSL